MSEEKEVALTVGVFPGFLNTGGKLLIQRRKERGSNIPGKSFLGDYELPGGGLTPEEMEQLRKGALFWLLIDHLRDTRDFLNNLDPLENILPDPAIILADALTREVKEEEGCTIDPVQLLRKFNQNDAYQAILVQKKAAKVDIAIAVPVPPDEWSGTPTGEFEWVDAERIRELSHKPKGEQIVSGWGKRMCQMMLWCLTFSCNRGIAIDAQKYLWAIQAEKGYRLFIKETVSVID